MLDADNLINSLKIQKGITSVIGSGGKTSLISYLASHLSEKGSVIITTTTHILPFTDYPFSDYLSESLNSHTIMVVGTLCANGKLTVPHQNIEELSKFADYVLVEADGSKGLPLKAHADYEPVILSSSNAIIAVIGIDGIGKPIYEAAHRPEIYASLLSTSIDTVVTTEMAANILKTFPSVTAFVINKADSMRQVESARNIASLLNHPTAITSFIQSKPIIEIWRNHKCLLS